MTPAYWIALLVLNAVLLAIVLAGWKWFPGRISNTVSGLAALGTAAPLIASQLASVGIDWRELVPLQFMGWTIVSIAGWVWVARQIPDPAQNELLALGRAAKKQSEPPYFVDVPVDPD
jgi:hypothetical protein